MISVTIWTMYIVFQLLCPIALSVEYMECYVGKKTYTVDINNPDDVPGFESQTCPGYSSGCIKIQIRKWIIVPSPLLPARFLLLYLLTCCLFFNNSFFRGTLAHICFRYWTEILFSTQERQSYICNRMQLDLSSF